MPTLSFIYLLNLLFNGFKKKHSEFLFLLLLTLCYLPPIPFVFSSKSNSIPYSYSLLMLWYLLSSTKVACVIMGREITDMCQVNQSSCN